MLTALLVCLGAFTILYLFLLLRRVRTGLQEAVLEEARAHLYEKHAGGNVYE